MSRTLWTAVLVCGLGLTGCTAPGEKAAEDAKVPITTQSEEARTAYLEGRELLENLRLTDARDHFQKAVELDEGFALAWLGLANTAQSNKDFWNALERAATEAEKVSEGERHIILAFDAGARSNPASQAQHLQELTAAFPKDERAQNQLGIYHHFVSQEYPKAIAAYEKAVEIAPNYAPPYNLVGYAHRVVGDYDKAEQAFEKYIELIPDDPNPYDSYAELLMKTGRFEESIANYQKALEHDPHFVASYVGIGLNHVYMENGEEARETLAQLLASARTPGEQRQALNRTAQSWVFQGEHDKALETVATMSAVAEGEGDKGAIAGDLNLMGNILLAAGRPDEADARFKEAVQMSAESNAVEEAKVAARRNSLFNHGRAALVRGALAVARAKAEEYAEQVAEHQVPFEQRQSHELMGLIALAEKDYPKAVAELQQANLQNPRVQYHLALAHQGAGEEEAARETCRKAAEHNGLNFNYAYVREKAKKMLEES
jgi:tetratricopeptide (TPR) repeat protein